MDHIATQAIELQSHEKQAVKCLCQSDWEGFSHAVADFFEAKKSLRISLIDRPVVQTQDTDVGNTIRKVVSCDPFPLEKLFEKAGIDIKDWDNIKSLAHDPRADDLLYSWFCNDEYVERLARIGSIVIESEFVPENLFRLFEDARHSYTFECYLAVVCLCRSLIEISVKDACCKKGINITERRLVSGKKPYSVDKSLQELIDLSTKGDLNRAVHRLRRSTNKVVHGRETASRDCAFETLKQTMNCIQEIYKVPPLMFNTVT